MFHDIQHPPTISRMQGPALVAVSPLIASFFIGTYVLARAGASAWLPNGRRVLAFFAPTAIAIGLLAGLGQLRFAALLFLACVAGMQAWVGLSLCAQAKSTIAKSSMRVKPIAR